MFAQPSGLALSLPSNNYSYISPQLIDRGAVAVRNRYDFFRNLWGVPEDLARLMESNNNLQALDIIGAYRERALQIPSAQLTAAIMNSQASWLSETASPLYPTSEFNFQATFREMNQIDFTRTAAGGVPNEQTYRVTSWKDTIEKVQLNARLEMDLQQDVNFGEDQWMFQLAGLTSNAMLTVHKTIGYSILHIAYANRVGEHMTNVKYDLSRALAMEEIAFGVAPFDQARYFRMIRDMREKILDFDLVIIPHNAASYIATLKGESTSMVAQKVMMDPETQQLQWAFCKGKKSIATFNYGEEVMHFVEMPRFRVNMAREASKEQIMRTSVTVGQAIPMHNPDLSWSQFTPDALTRDHLDVQVFHQQKNQGDEARISFIQALESAFYYDEESTDGLSKWVHEYCAYKNGLIKDNKDRSHIPYSYNTRANTKNALKDVNQDKSDCDTPDMDRVNKEHILDMKGWRDMTPILTYLPDQEEYRPANRIGAFMLNFLPNKAIYKVVKAIYHSVSIKLQGAYDFDTSMNEFYRLMNDLDNAPWSDEFIAALIDANITHMYDLSSGEPKFNPARRREAKSGYEMDVEKKESLFVNAADLQEWRGNQFGSLELPKKNGRITQVYPPGFGSGPGLERLAQEANDELSEWREAGIRAKRVVSFLDILNTILCEYIGRSEVNDERLTPPWFHVNSPITVLIDSLRHYKPPVFLAVPKATILVTSNDTFIKNNFDRWTRDSILIRSGTDVWNDSKIVPSGRVYFTNLVITVELLSSFRLPGLSVGDILVLSSSSKTSQRIVQNLSTYIFKHIYQKGGDRTMSMRTVAYIHNRLTVAAGKKGDLQKEELRAIEADVALIMNSNSQANRDGITKLIAKIKSMYEGDKATAGEYPSKAIVDNVDIQIATLRSEVDKEATVVPDTKNIVDKLNRLNELQSKADQDQDQIDTLVNELREDGYPSRTIPIAPSREPKITFDINEAPLTFLRAPLVSGDRLLEYLRRTPKPLIKPADPSVFYEAPLDMVTVDAIGHPAYAVHKKGTRVPFTAMPYGQIFRSGLNGVAFGNPVDRYEARGSRRYATESRTRDISDFIGRGFEQSSFGADMSEDYSRVRDRRNTDILHDFSGRDGKLNDGEMKLKQQLEKEEYYGPIESRYAFMETISSPFEKVLFKAITLAPNRMEFHQKIAAIGQKVLNVVIFRLFIQHIMSSTIVMKAGKDTLRTAIGHARVWVNTEQRGYSVINAGFYLGTVRSNPNAIQMIPYTFPEAFVGGMGVTFMREPTHFRRPTNAKDSMIAMVVPLTETKYTFPLHMLNLPTYKTGDIDNAPYYRKWSSSEYFAFIFNKNSLFEVQGHIEECKRSYGNAFDISLCAHRAPVTYLQANGRVHTVEGTGPRGNIRMNIVGAEKTWNGESINFPDIQSNHLRTF